MKAGRFRAGQAKAAAESFQVADHSGLTAYTSGQIGPQTVGIAELVTTHEEHFVNGYALGQQPDGRKWRHATRTPFTSSASVRIISTPLAKYGDKVVEIPEGDWIYQKRSADLIPDYRTLLLSVYGRKMSASNGALALDWAIDEETLTVTSATVITITDSSKSWDVNAYQNMYVLVGTGDGAFQHRLIASNTATVLTLNSDWGTIPEAGDAIDIVDWASPTMRRIDEATGAVVSSATVRAYAEWERFFVVLRPTSTFNYLYVRLRSASGTIWADGAKLEKATAVESGISTGSSATTLTDTNRGWVDDAHIGRQVIVMDGDDAGDIQTITDNDQTSLTAAYAATPSTASTYIIIPSNANLRPSPYLDLGQISASFYEASMYDLYAGTLLIGGGLSDAPRIVVEDRLGKALLKMGDFGDFKGIKFASGAGAMFEGGSIIMRADQGYEDADERVRMSYRGIEGWLSNDVRKWALLTQGAGFEFLISTSPLQARIVINDSDGIAAYTAEGRKWWGVRPQATEEDINYWWLGFEDAAWMSFIEDDGLLLHGSAVVDGTLTAAKINVANLQALSAQMGALTVDDTLTMGEDGVISWMSGAAKITDDYMDVALTNSNRYAFRFLDGAAVHGYFAGYKSDNFTQLGIEVTGPAEDKYAKFAISAIEFIGADPETVDFIVRSDTGVVFSALNYAATRRFQIDTMDSYFARTVGIGSTAIPTANGARVLFFGDNINNPTMDTNTAGIYAKDVGGTVEMFAIDEAENAAQLTPHDPVTGEWIFYTKNIGTGKVLRVNMEQMVRAVEEITGKTFLKEWVE